jgi:hypothetical protein
MSDIKKYIERMWPLPHISQENKQVKIFLRDTEQEHVKGSGVPNNE